MVDIIRRHPQSSLSTPSLLRSPLGALLRDLMQWDPFAELSTPALRAEGMFAPAFEVKENREGYQIKADLPGVREEDIQINVSGNRLTVSGKREEERRDENETYYYAETSYGAFNRTFTLPDVVDADACRAEMKNGQLIITVPKRAEMQTRQIAIKGEGAQKPDNNKQQKPRAQA